VAQASKSAQASSNLELVIDRVFNAPRDVVWKAWTDPEQLKQWSAPRGFKIPVSEGELRPGGAWRATMRKPDGEELRLGGEYREIVEPERLVFTHAWYDENGNPGPETLVTVTLTERDGKTAMNFRQTGFSSGDSRDGHAGGWTECFELLDELLSAGVPVR
jgi:uncharacterized protein YndB with AHSA1/START domain